MEILIKAKKGFTLIELMISVTIFSVIALFVSDIYLELSRFYANSVANRSAQQNVKVAIETITRYAKQSTVADWNPASRSLTVKPKDDLGNIINTVTFQLVTVGSTSSIKMRVDAGPVTFLTSEELNILNFNVRHNAGIPAIIEVEITAEIETAISPGSREYALERGISGLDTITMRSSTALKAQYNY